MPSVRILGKVPFRENDYYGGHPDYFPLVSALNDDAKWMEWYYRTATFSKRFVLTLDPDFSATGATTYERAIALPYEIVNAAINVASVPERAWLWPGADQEPLAGPSGIGPTFIHAPLWRGSLYRGEDDVFAQTLITSVVSLFGVSPILNPELCATPDPWPEPRRHFDRAGAVDGWFGIRPTLRVTSRVQYTMPGGSSSYDGEFWIQTPDPHVYFPAGTFDVQNFDSATSNFDGEDCEFSAVDLPPPFTTANAASLVEVIPTAWHFYYNNAGADPCWNGATGAALRDYHRPQD